MQAATEVRADAADRLAELGRQLSDAIAQMAKLKANCSGLQKKVAALQDKIDNAGGEPLRKQKEKVASLQVRCDILYNSIFQSICYVGYSKYTASSVLETTVWRMFRSLLPAPAQTVIGLLSGVYEG